MIIDYKIKFILHKRKSDDTKAVIRMRITLKSKRPIDISMGHRINIENWDTERQRVNSAERKANDINGEIEKWKSSANEVFIRYGVLEHREPSPDEFKQLFNDEIGRKLVFEESNEIQGIISVESAFDEYINSVGVQNSWSPSSYKKNETVKKHFVSSLNGKSFLHIDTDVLHEFIQYLLKKGLRNTTVAKDYQFVRWFLSWARRKGYYNGRADEDFRPRLKGTDGNQKEIIYLSLDELKQLESFQIPVTKKHLYHVRDVFLFCCYTSLRYSDVKKLNKSDIQGNKFRVVTQKTADAIIIDLNKKAIDILDRYKGVKGRLALPVISNQKYNQYLKELGRLAGLNTETQVVYYKGGRRYDEYYPKYELLTSHVARRTFVVTALQLGIPVEVIIRWTGHSNYDALKPYVAIVDTLKRSEMDKFDQL
ncbi:site-specific integrase [Bacteroides pyogenes]|uniref:Site-specific integrase n=3 Tax=Bacteroides pyogenes TaxID=310300 RepID=A0A5D3EE49_9BACE|nr:site-specific integrase [Bacteroides pyogenes]MCF2709968.1 phage integrase SAM-like domain-containing protein [Bacteroides pyogenes]TYK34384.1 site-specific integrase [Bacteroides pyogenes]TYK39399.1 site-specific integrase [Bacteroides pyogenes]TYK50164.1 site-specific integrase [Bacteroides pyogenes]